MILSSSGLEELVPEGEVLLPGDKTSLPLNWKLRLTPWPLWVSDVLKSTGYRTVLGGVIDPDYPGEIGLLLHYRGKKNVWNAGDPS